MDRVVSFGQTVARTKVNFTTTILKEWGSITGVTKEYTKVSGKTTKWKAKVFSLGQIGALIKEIIKMIKRRVRVYLPKPPNHYRRPSAFEMIGLIE